MDFIPINDQIVDSLVEDNVIFFYPISDKAVKFLKLNGWLESNEFECSIGVPFNRIEEFLDQIKGHDLQIRGH